MGRRCALLHRGFLPFTVVRWDIVHHVAVSMEDLMLALPVGVECEKWKAVNLWSKSWKALWVHTTPPTTDKRPRIVYQ